MFSIVVVVGAAFAIAAGVQASPPRDIPQYALSSVVVYKSEVVLAVFLSVYLLATAIALALEGRTIGKISTSGIELPSDLVSPFISQQELTEELERIQQDLKSGDRRLAEYLSHTWDELERLRTVSDGEEE